MDLTKYIDYSIIIDGTLRLESNTGESGIAGKIRWTGIDFEGYDGSEWLSLTSILIPHNDLLSFDGGVSGEYYHLTQQQHTDITALSSSIYNELLNIGTETINSTQWSYIGSLDQQLTTSDSPTFSIITLTGLFDGFVKATSGVLTGDNNIDLTNDITGILPVLNGGTNSNMALINDRVMISSGGSIVESPFITVSELSILNGISLVVQGSSDNNVFATQGYIDDRLDEKITGPIVANNNAVAVFDGTNGKLLRTSNVLVYTNGDVYIPGDVTINGTLNYEHTSELQVTDKIIGLAVIGSPGSGTDITANGGGIVLYGDTDKTILWDIIDSRWHFNQGIDIIGGIYGSSDLSIDGDIIIGGTIDGVDIAALSLNTANHISDLSIHYMQSAISISASQVNDFDIEVANNTDVTSNTISRHTHTNKIILDDFGESGSPIQLTHKGLEIHKGPITTDDVIYDYDHNHINTVQDVISHIWSAGSCNNGFNLTENINGTINISSGSILLRIDNSKHGNLQGFNIIGVTNFVLTDNATNYILVDYNNGSPQLVASIDLVGDVFNNRTKTIIYAVNKLGNALNIVDLRSYNVNYIAENAIKDYRVNGFEHAYGAIISDNGSLEFAVSASTFFILNIKLDNIAFNSNPNTFEYVYRNGIGGWSRVASQVSINYNHYDDGSGTLALLDNNDYGVHHVYLVSNTPSHYKVVYGRNTYITLAAAQEAGRPDTLPSDLDAYSTAIFIGNIITNEGNITNFVDIQSPFTEYLISIAPNTHNALAGLQGGTTNEYYHLASAQYIDLTDSGNATIHYHSSDRNRLNHTGTQTAITISDFDTEVSNNIDVAANTANRHFHTNKSLIDLFVNFGTPDRISWNGNTIAYISDESNIMNYECHNLGSDISSPHAHLYKTSIRTDNAAFHALSSEYSSYNNSELIPFHTTDNINITKLKFACAGAAVAGGIVGIAPSLRFGIYTVELTGRTLLQEFDVILDSNIDVGIYSNSTPGNNLITGEIDIPIGNISIDEGKMFGIEFICRYLTSNEISEVNKINVSIKAVTV